MLRTPAKRGMVLPYLRDRADSHILETDYHIIKNEDMQPLVSIIMGSTSDLPVMEKACKLLEEQEIPF